MVSFDDYKLDEVVYQGEQSLVNREEMSRKSRVLIQELSAKSLERDELARLVVLAFLSSKHMFLIGKPGVGKTFLVNKLKHILKDGKVFEYLLAEDTEPAEIYGYNFVDENGKVNHVIERSIIGANLISLDEMFKAKSGLLNGMLGALSQSRNFFLRDFGEKKLPLISAFVMSNEFPKDEILDPFDDRLHFRYEVLRLKEDESFKKLVTKDYDTTNHFSVGFTYSEILSLRSQYEAVEFKGRVLEFFILLKNNIVRNELNISDRKLDDAVEVFRASAYLNGRDEIDYSDMFILMHMGWRNYTERRKLHQIVYDTFFQKKEDLEKNLILMREQMQKIKSYGISNVDPFVFDRIKFNFEENDDIARHNNYVDFFLSMLEALRDLRGNMEYAKDMYEFTLDVEDLVERNIFLNDYKNSSFSEKYLIEYAELFEVFGELYNKYIVHAQTKAKKLEFN